LATDALSKFNTGRLPWQPAGNKKDFKDYGQRSLGLKRRDLGANLTRKARMASGLRAAWSEDVMKSAVDAVRQNQMGLNQAAKQFSVPKAILQRHVERLNKRSQDGKKQLGRSQDLLEEIEDDLVSRD